MSAELPREDLDAALACSEVAAWSWNPKTGVLTGTRAFARLFGFEEGSPTGSFIEQVHAEDRERVVTEFRRCAETRQPYRIRYRVNGPDGRVRWHEGRCAVRLDESGVVSALVGTTQDITLAQSMALRLEETEEMHRLIGELSSDYIYSVDALTFQLRIVAGSFERTTGYTAEEVRQRGGWFTVVHPDDRARMEGEAPLAFSGRPFVNEYRIIDKHGQVRWVRDHVKGVKDASGQVVQIVGGVQEITERKRLEEQLVHASKMEALARLAGGVAHDFNNLLTVILSSTAWLRLREGSAVDRGQALNDIEQAGRRAADLTRQLLMFGRRQPTNPSTVDVSKVVLETEGLLRRSLPDNVKLEVHLGDGAAAARIDPSNLQLVLLNLVVNARDAMPGGGRLVVRVSTQRFAEATPQRPPELPEGDYVVIEVEDSGVGIPPEVRKHIFEPFFTTKGPGHGTGLGLATVYGVIAQASGAVTLESTVGRGTTFRVVLPRRSEGATVVPASPALPTGGSEHVLLVEDEPLVRSVAQRALMHHGYRVTPAGSAEEALELMTRLTPDVLVSDVRMPGKSGVELAVALTSKWPGLPVLLMSGDLGSMLDVKGYPLLEKPFTAEGLVRRLREVLDAGSAKRVEQPG